MYDDPSMVLSTHSLSLDAPQSYDSVPKVVEMVSELSVPTINIDALGNEEQRYLEKVRKLQGVSTTERDVIFFVQEIKSEGSERSINPAMKRPERHHGKAETLVERNPNQYDAFRFGNAVIPQPGRKKRVPVPPPNQRVLESLGQCEFEARYVATPPDVVVMALSMCEAHVEVAGRLRDTARYWLEVWNMGSREYQALVRKGKNICGL